GFHKFFLTIAVKPSNIIAVDWSVSGFYDIAVALGNNYYLLLISSICRFILFVTVTQCNMSNGCQNLYSKLNLLSPDSSVYND
ncbi:MAG: hypothetical protein N2B04_03330, partial [Psychrobacter sp.]